MLTIYVSVHQLQAHWANQAASRHCKSTRDQPKMLARVSMHVISWPGANLSLRLHLCLVLRHAYCSQHQELGVRPNQCNLVAIRAVPIPMRYRSCYWCLLGMVSWVRVYMYSISELACGSCLCEPMTSADPHGRCCRHSCDPCAAKISTLCSANSSCSWIRILTRYFGKLHMSACATRLCSCGISICSVNSLLMHANVRQHLTARCSGLLCRQSANEPAVPFQYRYAPKPCVARLGA